MNASSPSPRSAYADRILHALGRALQALTLAGLLAFTAYIVLRASGRTPANFSQWKALVEGLPMETASAWVANLGIGLHFLAGLILITAWPLLLSSRIRSHHRAVHRWTGRIYVSAGGLAGVGGISFILSHGAYVPAASVAFAIWGAGLFLCAAMTYVHARARRLEQHRAWALRLFAMVLGAWLFDLEFRGWKDLTGGAGIGNGDRLEWFDYALLYLFFVPNLLVAEFLIRRGHRHLGGRLIWAAIALAVLAVSALGYATYVVTATPGGKYGEHLLSLLSS
jgi:hypothetical protein